jgi:hypothetical protein
LPAFDLSRGKQELRRCDVVGRRTETPLGFVRHVALLNDDQRDIGSGQVASVRHMGPPLETRGQLSIHVGGRVPLTTAEVTAIETWVEKIADEYREAGANGFKQYTIRPHWVDHRDPNTGVRRYRRYSCAGFVLDGHNQVDIRLLNTDEENLPEVDRQTLSLAYPEFLDHPRILREMGIQGGGPWRVVLAGYVLHSLARSTEEIRGHPYQPQPGDEFF